MRAKSDKDKADTLAEFFTSVFTAEPCGPLPQPQQREIDTQFQEPDITEALVREQLRKLNPCKAAGPDGIHPRVLMELSEVLARPLAIIFNTSLRTGKVPQVWREAHVAPIFKKGERTLPSNYRPVSLTSVVCKVMGKIVRSWVMDHLDRNDLLSDRQFGFIPGRSTTLHTIAPTITCSSVTRGASRDSS